MERSKINEKLARRIMMLAKQKKSGDKYLRLRRTTYEKQNDQ